MLPLTISPLTSRIARRLRGRLAIERYAERVVEVAPATSVGAPPPPIHDADELRRVTGTDEFSSLAEQWRLLAGTEEFGAAFAYLLPPMTMVDGNLAGGRRRHDMSTDRERLIVADRLPSIRGHAFASTPFGNRFFAHQILDNLPTALIASTYGTPTLAAPPGGWGAHVADYQRLLGFDLAHHWSARTIDSWVFHDPFLNDSKLARLQVLRDQLRSRRGATAPATSGERVMMLRGSSGAQRAPTNELALAERLAGDGWQIVDHTALDVDALASILASAAVVVSVEGSQLAHAAYAMRPGAAVIVLIPPTRFTLLLKDFFDRLGITFGFHVGCPGADGTWTVDRESVERLVERAVRETPR